MRILLCPSAYAPHVGGVEELTARLAEVYRQEGHSVEVVTTRWPLDLPQTETVKGVTVRRIDYVLPRRSLRGLARFGLRSPRALFALANTIRRFKPDVVHIQCVAGQGFYLLLLKPVLRFRLVVTLQGERRMDATGLYARRLPMTPILRGLLRAADVVTACSQATLDDVNDIRPPQMPASVVWNGISLDEFDATDTAALPLPARPYIFATGRHVRNKGFDILIDAFSRIAPRYPGIDLVIGGDGDVHAALQAQIARLGLADRVHLPGYLNRAQTVAWFRSALFFVLPSRYEPFGIVNLEAMAAGKAVVAAQTGGVGEIVQPDTTGVLVPPDDAPALANALATLLDAPELADAYGRAGRARVAQLFTWPKLAAQYTQIYGRVHNGTFGDG